MKLNPNRSANPDSMEHAEKMSAYRKMDNNRGVKEYARDYMLKSHKAKITSKHHALKEAASGKMMAKVDAPNSRGKDIKR